MTDIFDLYDEYIYIDGRWEKIGGNSSNNSMETLLYFDSSITPTELSNLDIDDLEIGASYNINDDFITDIRFKEGSGVSYPEGTCITVIKQGSQKYFNILGSVFNIDYIENQIASINTLLSNLQLNWNNVTNKPFSLIGEGLSVNSDGELNASQILSMITNITIAWSNIISKPFSNIGTGLDVINDTLKVIWDDIEDKLFDDIGNGLIIENGVLKTTDITATWDNVSNKPFEKVSQSDFSITTSGGKKWLYLSSSNKHYRLSTYDIQEICNVISS